MGDMVVANESAFFLQAFRRIGLVPDGGATYLCRAYRHGTGPRIDHYGRPPTGPKPLWNGGLSLTALRLMINCSMKPVRWLPNGARPALAKAYPGNLLWESIDAKYEEQLNNELVPQRTAGRTQDLQKA